MSSAGADRIAQERARQKKAEGWTEEHDDRHKHDELALAAACYAAPRAIYVKTVLARGGAQYADPWPWSEDWDKRHDVPARLLMRELRIRDLEKAGALIAAEIDRLLRIEEKASRGQ